MADENENQENSPVSTEGTSGAGTASQATETEASTPPSETPASEGVSGKDANPAESSPADTDAKEGKPLKFSDVVKNVLEKKEEVPGSSSGSTEGDAKPKEGKADTEAKGKDAKEGEEELPPFHDHPRWKELNKKHNEIIAERDELKPAAQQYQKIEDFRVQNNLEVDELVQTFRIAALVKNEPEKALQEVYKIASDLENIVGITLPADLKDQVDKGYMTEEAARELSMARSREARYRERANQATETTRRTTEEQRATQLNADIANASIQWANQKAKVDPDIKAKETFIVERVGAICRERGKPLGSVADAHAVLEQAHKEVSQRLSSFGPRQNKPIARTPAGNPGQKTTVSAKPKSLRDAVMKGVQEAAG